MQQIHFKRKYSHITANNIVLTLLLPYLRLGLFTFTYKIGGIVILYLQISLSSKIILTKVLILDNNFCMDYTALTKRSPNPT